MFEELGELAVADFDREISGIPADLCAPFFESANRLEAGLLSIYRTVTLCQRDVDDLGQVAQYWKAMVNVCDASLLKLSALIKAHPLCNAEHFHDRILDLRNKCQRLYQMHS